MNKLIGLATSLILFTKGQAFVPTVCQVRSGYLKSSEKVSSTCVSAAIAVPAAELVANLTEPEKNVISVVRRAGPSVAFVTSVWPDSTNQVQREGNRRSRNRNRRRDSNNNKDQENKDLPPGQSLGSGSGFVVESDGYIVTNYHVIERAYELQSAYKRAKEMTDAFVGNYSFASNLVDLLNRTVQQKTYLPTEQPLVYCKINSSSQYKQCRIVDVKPNLDVAVLRTVHNTTTTADAAPLDSVDFGSSGQLLVGQSLVAIGNPFGLEQTVSTGVVSALDREILTSGSSERIRGCIQTDAAINPGNSGGPLLDLNGNVVGVNTAIITTSGSNAGIGFAIPSDEVQIIVKNMIRKDRIENGFRPNVGYLGIGIMQSNQKNDTTSTLTSISTTTSATDNNDNDKKQPKNWIVSIDPSSPAGKVDINKITIEKDTGKIIYGDAIVAISGNYVNTFDEVVKELETRVVGEEIALTLQDRFGEKRVVYVKLGEKK